MRNHYTQAITANFTKEVADCFLYIERVGLPTGSEWSPLYN